MRQSSRLDRNYVLYENEKFTTTDSWQRMNAAKPIPIYRTPPQPTGLIKLFELKLTNKLKW